MKKIIPLAIVVFGLVPLKMSGQVSINYFPFQSVISVSSDVEHLVWGEMRLDANTFFSNVNIELDAMINLKRTEWVNYYTGLGVNLNPTYAAEDLDPINGYLVHLGARIKPLSFHRNVHLIFEISPYFNPDFDGGQLRAFLGLGYNF